MQPSHKIRPVFDDPNLVSSAGLVPALRLTEAAGRYDLLGGLTVASPNAAAKTTCVLGGMLAGADSIGDLDLLRHGGMTKLLGGVRGAVDAGHVPALVHLWARAAARQDQRWPPWRA